MDSNMICAVYCSIGSLNHMIHLTGDSIYKIQYYQSVDELIEEVIKIRKRYPNILINFLGDGASIIKVLTEEE